LGFPLLIWHSQHGPILKRLGADPTPGWQGKKRENSYLPGRSVVVATGGLAASRLIIQGWRRCVEQGIARCCL